MRIHSASTTAADRSPAMYRSETIATVVSKTSINVGMITAAATNQALIAGRLAAAGASATLLMMRAPLAARGPMRVRVWGPLGLLEVRQRVARLPRHAAPWAAP